MTEPHYQDDSVSLHHGDALTAPTAPTKTERTNDDENQRRTDS